MFLIDFTEVGHVTRNHHRAHLRPPTQEAGCPHPSKTLPEQAAIARFLDHADRRIWRYIGAKERLIELVEEQKQAIIHGQAVNGPDRRPNRSSPIRPTRTQGSSGWKGCRRIWEVRRLGQIGVFFKCSGGTKADDVPAGVPCTSIRASRTRNSITSSSAECPFLSPENVERYSSVECGDVLHSRGQASPRTRSVSLRHFSWRTGHMLAVRIIAFRSAPTAS